MRPLPTLVAALLLAGVAAAQPDGVPARFDVIHNPDVYFQDTPQRTLNAVLDALSRDRYDYVVAHLLDPAFVDARLGATQSYFERVAADQLAPTLAASTLRAADLDARVRTVGLRLNVQDLIRQIRRKQADEPENLRDLRRIARDGQFQTAGETATATLPDAKDRALYFKKVGDRWFLENRRDDRPPT
ncbi:MAG TPA: hypothetical protein VKD90_23560 [Gemmataceae bacterium]|nr:hypothetical protein [Gemmataceae bacterium]